MGWKESTLKLTNDIILPDDWKPMGDLKGADVAGEDPTQGGQKR